MTRLQLAVDEAVGRMQEISNFLFWNDAQRAEKVIEGAFYDGGSVCLIPIFADGSRGFATKKATYQTRPYWVADTK